MTYPGRGGQQPAPYNAPAGQAPQPGITPGVPPVLRVTEIVIVPGGALEGIFTYSSNPPAANTLIESSNVATAGTDIYGNHFLAGSSTYSTSTATTMGAGYVQFYTGSLAAGWSLAATIQTDVLGDLILASISGTIELASDATASNLTVSGTLSVAGSTQTGTGLPAGTPTGAPNGTGFFNTQGLASGSYGSTHQHTLPNFPTATHTHDFDGHTHQL